MRLLVISVLIALPSLACAAQLEVLSLLNWQRLPIGEQNLAEGGAMVARVNGPAAGYLNPAGLADLAQPSVSGTVDVVEYTRVAARSDDSTTYADDIQLKPNMVGFANQLGEASGWSFTLASPISWSSGLEVRSSGPDGSRRDDGRSSLESTCGGLAWGGRVNRALALGFAIEGWVMDYRLDTGTSAQDGTSVLTATYTERGRQVAMRLALGSQWQGEQLRAGAVLRSPGVIIQGQGSISSSSTSGDGTTTVLDEIADDTSGFIVPLPWQVVLGLAWIPAAIPGLELEADLEIHSGNGTVEVFPGASGTRTTVSSGGITNAPISQPARTLALRPVFNPRLGLRYRFPNTLFERIVYGHLGGYIERSPVDDSTVFSQLDMLGGTAGLSLEKGPMLVTLAAAYVTSGTVQDAIGFVSSPESGLSPEISDANAVYAVRTFSLTIGSSYRF